MQDFFQTSLVMKSTDSGQSFPIIITTRTIKILFFMVEEQMFSQLCSPDAGKGRREVIFQNLSWWDIWTRLSEILPTKQIFKIFTDTSIWEFSKESLHGRGTCLCKRHIVSGAPGRIRWALECPAWIVPHQGILGCVLMS